MTLLNIHDDERQKPENWIPVGWLPMFDDKKTDSGLKEFECAHVSVLEQYTGRRAPGMLILAYFRVFLIIFDYF